MGNYHVPFWRAVEEVTPSLTLIIEMVGTGNWHDLKWTGSDSKTTSVANCDELSRILTPSG